MFAGILPSPHFGLEKHLLNLEKTCGPSLLKCCQRPWPYGNRNTYELDVDKWILLPYIP